LRLALLAGVAVLAFFALQLSRKPGRRVVELPAGIVELHSEMRVDSATDVRGAPTGTLLRAAPDFAGRALVVVSGAGVALQDFAIDGNRQAIGLPQGLPPYDQPFARFTRGNGILADGVTGLSISRVRFREVAGFAVLVARSRDVFIDQVEIEASGGRNAAGRNNTTGGILLEEGTTDFRVTRCRLRAIRGNGIWTHSLYTSPRNARGLIRGNRIDQVGRDAIQVGHATRVRVEQNLGARIGFPVEDVDIENLAIPVAIDTAGNVERSAYVRNRFDEINGKGIDLDGFHDGEIRGNVCVNREAPEKYKFGNYGIVMNNSNPDMQSRNIRVVENLIDGPLFGGIFVIGTGHTVEDNRLLRLNTAHCNEDAARFGCYYAPGEPGMLRSGIYLGRGAERPAPASGNIIRNNEISGFKMNARCVTLAPGIPPDANVIRGNRCRD
jgi:hypothetical protein